MSKISVSRVETGAATTDLVIGTGNTSGPTITISSANANVYINGTISGVPAIPAFAQANAAQTVAILAFAQANAAQTVAILAYNAANTAKQLQQNYQTSNYTLVVTDAGKHVSITTGNVTIPSAVFSNGDMVTIYNNSITNRNIVNAAAVTMRLAGSNNQNTRVITQYGLATIFCVGANTFVVSGAGLL